MPRLHLIELAEQPWCPRAVRDGLTDYLQWAIDVGDAYGSAAPPLADLLRRSGRADVVDLGAGGGGPWRRLRPALQAHGVSPRIRLTDREPNLGAFARAELDSDGAVQGDRRPIEATRIPGDLQGVRTMFSVFHHLRPREARAFLREAARQRVPIAVFEATARTPKALLVTMLVPLLVLLATPMLRPVRMSRLLLTYLLPIIPLVAWWDGVVSCLRTYSPEELRALVADLDVAPDWEWSIAQLPGRSPLPVTMLMGEPRARSDRLSGSAA